MPSSPDADAYVWTKTKRRRPRHKTVITWTLSLGGRLLADLRTVYGWRYECLPWYELADVPADTGPEVTLASTTKVEGLLDEAMAEVVRRFEAWEALRLARHTEQALVR